MRYARVVDGVVVDSKTADEIPPHKLHLWKPEIVEGNGPLRQTIIGADAVRVLHSHPPLDATKLRLMAQVDDDAERCRMRYLTPGAGMSMTYAEKFAQANAVHGLGQDAANAMADAHRQFPTLAASVGIEAQTLWDCAQLVIEKYEQFAALSGIIERARLSGKKAISDASDADSARAAYEGITWPTP